MAYLAPIKDMLFVMRYVSDLAGVTSLERFSRLDLDTVQAVLEESARFCEKVIAPLNTIGDRHPSACVSGQVTTPPGYENAYRQFKEGGWQGLAHPAEFGGQELPRLVATACTEMLHAASMSFALCPMLTDGAIEALLTAGSPVLREKYVHKLVSGEWSGTMNLTESQAGSDLAAVRTRAEPLPDGTYRIAGTKIFITYGEHGMSDNIVHMVLARTPGAPVGVKGISLFAVPKFLVNDDGSLGKRNDVQCLSIEHKLGIHGSPTAVLQFGDQGGAIGELVGEVNQGLKYMFIMMNAARFNVGMQGIGIADRAYQQALTYARNRVQGRPPVGHSVSKATDGTAPIVEHPDVKRMLLTMKSVTEGARAVAYTAAAIADLAQYASDADTRARNQALYEFLVPIVKGHATELAVETTSLGVQVHGGVGYIEETGAAQHFRDARILAIYEGTTAIQANDLVGRKTMRDGGRTARDVLVAIERTERELAAIEHRDALVVRDALAHGRECFQAAVEFILAHANTQPAIAYAAAVPYLRLVGVVLSGWQLARSMQVAIARRDDDFGFYDARIALARFYAETIMPQAHTLRRVVERSSATVANFPCELL